MTAGEVVEAITQMRYPRRGCDPVNAGNAAILLMAKDRLSALAAPARGYTIAYTEMFIDPEVTLLARLRQSWVRRNARRINPVGADDPDQDTRVDLAVRAFPELKSHACRFRLLRDALAVFALFWLLLTALAYWDAGLGRVSLERLDLNWKGFTEEVRDNPVLLNCDTSQHTSAGASSDAKAVEEAARAALACRRHEYNRWKAETAGTEVRSVFRCEQRSRILHVWCWRWLMLGNNPVPGTDSSSDQSKESATPAPVQDASRRTWLRPEIEVNATYWQTATSVLSVFTTYILPMMFALLGTLIGAFRAILKRIANRELAPRDFVRMFLGIPTGLVAGIAVGFFLSPSSVPIQGAGSVGGQLTLTASGLGFLAGYASHSFFTYLDNVVGTVFPNTAETNVPAARQPANVRT